MRTIVKGKNIDVPEPVRKYAERKMHRLERYLDDRSEAVIELSTEQHRSVADSQIVELTLVIDGQTLRSHAAGPTYQAGLDTVIDKIERQAVDFIKKPRDKTRPVAARAKHAEETPIEGPAQEGEPRIVRTKRFAIEPMFPEDAVTRMEELGHEFFIFVDAEDEKLCVLYRRTDGGYGIIEPVLGGEYTPGRAAGRGPGRNGKNRS